VVWESDDGGDGDDDGDLVSVMTISPCSLVVPNSVTTV
jgi:hypothetical protein